MENAEKSRRGMGTRAAVVAILLLGVVTVAARAMVGRRERAVGSPGAPLVLVLSPDHAQHLAPADRASLAVLLRRESGLAVDVRVAESPLDAVEAFGTLADAGLLNIFEYALARKEHGVEAGMQVLRGDGATGYAGVIAVRADSGAADLAGLAGKRIAYVGPYSTSGFVFPAKILADAGVEVVAEFSGEHPGTLESLRSGATDAAATFEAAVAGETGLRVIARTDTIPNEPLVFRSGLLPEKRAALARALERLAADSEGARILAASADVTGFRPVTDREYAGVIAAIRAAGLSVYAVVPEGHDVASRRSVRDYLP